MTREENSAAPGPHTVGRTRSRAQPVNAVSPPADASIIEEQCQRLREDARQTELRDRDVVEADQCMAWKSGEMRPPFDYRNTPGSSVAADAGSPRCGAESDVPHDDALKNAADHLHDGSECLRGIDPNDNSATLESCPHSAHDFSAELPSTLPETGSGRLENGFDGGSRG